MWFYFIIIIIGMYVHHDSLFGYCERDKVGANPMEIKTDGSILGALQLDLRSIMIIIFEGFNEGISIF